MRDQLVRISENQHTIAKGTEYESAPNYPHKDHNSALIDLFKNVPASSFATPAYVEGTGRVSLTGLKIHSLSLENGRQQLDVVRIAFTRDSNDRWTVSTFYDYMRVLERVPGLNLIVTVRRDELPYLEKLIEQQRVDVRNRIEVVTSASTIDVWSQDGSKPIDLPRQTIEGNVDRFTVTNQAVNGAAGLSVVRPFNFQFEGGDVIVGDRHVIVGVNQLRLVTKQFGCDDSEAVHILTRAFGKPVIVAGIKKSVPRRDGSRGLDWEPWNFHIDLDMALVVDRRTDREVALVQSPKAFFELFAPEVRFSEVPTIQEIKRAIDVIVGEVKRKSEAGELISKGEMALANFLASYSTVTVQEVWLKSELFKRSLEANGYEVENLPGVGYLDNSNFTQNFFFGTNVVLSRGTALLPKNHVPKLDSDLARIYQTLGYEVIPMKSASESICLWGGTRCASETFRKPYIPIGNRPRN